MSPISDEIVKQMLAKASLAIQKAYAPYSKFYVGACVCADDDTLYAGCNIENASYGLTQCAERCAISCMVAAGKRQIKAMLVIGPGDFIITPCGACRQMMREFSPPHMPVYLCDNKEVREIITMAELLPKSFGPEFLET